ncbi:MAG: DUF4124 domain-containing protein [Gammaproteobacteria bacterium]|nr:DUF4124 domain-containing protein [Gammaproteobacteria bacterium]
MTLQRTQVLVDGHQLRDTGVLRQAAAICCVLLSCATLADPADPTIYRVIDAQGKVSYTDTPPKDGTAEPVTLKEVNTQPAMDARKVPVPAPDAATNPYTRIEIASPANDSTIPPGQLSVVVQLQLEPALQPGHMVQFYLDGKPQGPAAAATAITLDELYRGSRAIHAAIVDAKGTQVAQSNSVVIHVKRPSVKSKRPVVVPH